MAVVLIDGAGSSFSAGYDLADPRADKPDGWLESEHFDSWTDQFARSVFRDWMTIWDLLKPVVAKVHGYCLAGGTELMSMCDIAFVVGRRRHRLSPHAQHVQSRYAFLSLEAPHGASQVPDADRQLRDRAGGGAHGVGREKLSPGRARGAGAARAATPGADRPGPARGQQGGAQPGVRADGPAHPPARSLAMASAEQPRPAAGRRVRRDRPRDGLRAAIEQRDEAFRREGFRPYGRAGVRSASRPSAGRASHPARCPSPRR